MTTVVVERVVVDVTGRGARGPTGNTGPTGGDAQDIGLYSALSSPAISSGLTQVHTSGYSETGLGAAWYIYDAAVDSTFVAAHPGWSFLAANGRGFRLSENHPDLTMFGAIPDYNGTTIVTDSYTGWTRAVDYLTWDREQHSSNTLYRTCLPLFVPMGWYYSSDTWDLDFGAVYLHGVKAGHPYGGYGTKITFVAGKTGIRIQNYNTSEDTTIANRPGGQGSFVEGIETNGAGDNVGQDADGFRLRGYCIIRDCSATNFSRDGLNALASLGGGTSTEGNTNTIQIYNFYAASNGRDGVYLDGADGNAITAVGLNCINNGRYGWNEDSFLGNYLLGHHCQDNGHAAAGYNVARVVYGNQCSYGGNRYYIALGQETAASTTTPGTDATKWVLVGAGGVNSAYPAWTSGLTWAEGGAWKSNGSSAQASILGGYTETGQPPSRMGLVTMVTGGANFAGFDSTTGSPDYIRRNGGGFTTKGWTYSYSITAGTVTTTVGYGDNTTPAFLSFYSPNHSLGWRLKELTNDLIFDYQNSNSNSPFLITGTATTRTFGRTAAVKFVMWMQTPVIGNRVRASGTAVPGTGDRATGETLWNDAPLTGATAQWTCTTGHATTGGTWRKSGALFIDYSTTYDPPSLATGAIGAEETYTVTGAALGDFVQFAFSLDTQGVVFEGRVSATDTVKMIPRNPTAGTIDLGSGTIRVRVTKGADA